VGVTLGMLFLAESHMRLSENWLLLLSCEEILREKRGISTTPLGSCPVRISSLLSFIQVVSLTGLRIRY
jgi:hypothetical protein